MSPARTPRFAVAKTSTHNWVSCAQRSRGSWISFCARSRRLFAGMLPPQCCRFALELDGLLEYRVVAMPLHEIGSAHKGSVLRRAPVIVPKIEVEEVDRVGE